uniref:Uncharacterized protein n=1 Tax=Ananas comosus var. bracteatus TaxID=296719 RepID=A0A6V7Q6L3_ANACO|nr:unnamed protein product [Ananas comosus var. bracteatus]
MVVKLFSLLVLNLCIKTYDINKHGTEQGGYQVRRSSGEVSEDESLRVAYKHGTPLEGGKIAESKPVDLFADARRIDAANRGAATATATTPPPPLGRSGSRRGERWRKNCRLIKSGLV